MRGERTLQGRYDQLLDRYRSCYRAYYVEYDTSVQLAAQVRRNKVVILVLPFLSAVFAASFVTMIFLATGRCG